MTKIKIVDFQTKNHEYQDIHIDEVSGMLKKNFRYSLGRHTYVVSWCVGQIMEHVEYLSDEDKEFIIDKLNKYFKNLTGEWDMDIEEWRELLRFLTKVEFNRKRLRASIKRAKNGEFMESKTIWGSIKNK